MRVAAALLLVESQCGGRGETLGAGCTNMLALIGVNRHMIVEQVHELESFHAVTTLKGAVI